MPVCLDTLSVCIRNATFLCDYHRYHFLDSLLIFYGILFVCCFPSICSAYVYISHFPCAHAISIPFASISIGYYDYDYYDYYCACVDLLFSIFLFCNAAFFIRSKFNVLFENFMNRITINLSTSTTEKIHMKCTIANNNNHSNINE